MNHFKAVFLGIALLSIPSLCHASLYEVNISASLSTQVVTGSTYSVHTVPVTNASIIKAIVTSGSFPGLKAKDLAVVYAYDFNETVEVVNTSSSNAVVAVIAVTGSNSSFNAIESESKTREVELCTSTDYEFTLPNAGATLVTNTVIKFDINPVSFALENFSFSFVGASGLYSSGSTFFQGTIKKGTKVYPGG